MADLNPFASFAQGRQLAMQKRAEDRLIEDREREATTRNRLAQLFAGGVPATPEGRSAVVAEVARTDPRAALGWQERFDSMEPNLLARRKGEAPFIVAQLGNVADQAGYERAVANLAGLGVDVSDMPPEYDPERIGQVTQAARYLAEGPPKAGGPFEGTGLMAQAHNILLTKDPRSPEYAAAYGIVSQPRTYLDQGSGQMVTVQPNVSAYAAPGTMQRAATTEAKETPAPMGPPGTGVKVTEGKPTMRPTNVPGVTVTQVGDKPLTEGQKARDRAFGKEYVTWTGGGQADAERNIVQLEEQIARLESGENLTGPIIGNQPRVVAQFATPSAVDVQEQVEEVVQRNLREVLGPQFTEKEGERLISRAYNPTLDESVNARRLRRLVQQMRNAAAAKNAMAQHFDQFGTLQGYEGPRMLTMGEMGDIVEAEGGESEGEAPTGDLPEGVTEEDVKFTMEKHGLTRAQVLERLR